MGNDVAENPGPETKAGEVSVFHWNSRSIRHKLDHLQTISNDSSIICVTESHKKIRLIRSLKKFIFRYQYLVEIYSVSAEKIISDAFSYSENV